MKFNNVALGLASAAPVLLGGFALLLALGVPPAVQWFWPAPATNAAEAVALGDAARVRTLAARGERLDVPLPVRAAVLDGEHDMTISPLEAAVRRRGEDSLVPVLLDLGVHPPPQEVHRLYCLAERLRATDAAARLDEAFDRPAVPCER